MAVIRSSADLAVTVAKVAVTTVISGPVAGISSAIETTIDTAGARWGQNTAYQQAIDGVSRAIRAWATAERIGSAEQETGLRTAAEVIARHGLSARGMARADLDAQRISTAVLTAGRAELRPLSEAEEVVARAAVESAYRALLEDPALLPALERATEQEVLSRFSELSARLDQQDGPAAQAEDRAELLHVPVARWNPALHPPSALLRAEYRVVAFEQRDTEMAALRAWCADESPLRVRLYTGAGGMGKTRLLSELCLEQHTRGWRTGFLDPAAAEHRPGWPALVTEGTGAVLVVIDYAEGTAGMAAVRTLIGHVTAALAENRRLPRVRCVLLARAVADWWHDLTRTRGPVGEVLTGPATEVLRLGPVATTPDERPGLVQRAFEQFSAVLGTPATAVPLPDLSGADFDRILFLHLAALSSATGSAAAGRDPGGELLDAALRREQSFWDDGARALALPSLAGRPMTQAAAIVTLAGRIDSAGQAVEILRAAPLLADQPGAVLDDLAELLHRLYPGTGWLEGVQPDLLGEHLVGRALAADPSLVRVFGGP